MSNPRTRLVLLTEPPPSTLQSPFLCKAPSYLPRPSSMPALPKPRNGSDCKISRGCVSADHQFDQERGEHRVLVSALKRFVPLPFHRGPQLTGSGWLLQTLVPSFQPSAPQRSFIVKSNALHPPQAHTVTGGRQRGGACAEEASKTHPRPRHSAPPLLCHQDVGDSSRGGERAE